MSETVYDGSMDTQDAVHSHYILLPQGTKDNSTVTSA